MLLSQGHALSLRQLADQLLQHQLRFERARSRDQHQPDLPRRTASNARSATTTPGRNGRRTISTASRPSSLASGIKEVYENDENAHLIHGRGLRSSNPKTKQMASRPSTWMAASRRMSRRRTSASRWPHWMTSPKNPFFARAIVNRVWKHYLGRGLGRRGGRFPRHQSADAIRHCSTRWPDDFSSHGYDLRHLMRTILNSRTYQLSAEPNDSNRARHAELLALLHAAHDGRSRCSTRSARSPACRRNSAAIRPERAPCRCTRVGAATCCRLRPAEPRHHLRARASARYRADDAHDQRRHDSEEDQSKWTSPRSPMSGARQHIPHLVTRAPERRSGRECSQRPGRQQSRISGSAVGGPELERIPLQSLMTLYFWLC